MSGRLLKAGDEVVALGRRAKNAGDYLIGALAPKLNAPLVIYNKRHFEWLPGVLTPGGSWRGLARANLFKALPGER